MAPKKTTKAASAAPVRRSARLASRSPSAEAESVSLKPRAKVPFKKVSRRVHRPAPSREEPLTPLLTIGCAKCKANRENCKRERNMTDDELLVELTRDGPYETPPKPSNLRRHFKMQEIQRVVAQQEQTPPQQLSPPRLAAGSLASEVAVETAPSPSSPPQTAKKVGSAAPATPGGWFKTLSKLSGYIASPFARKRAAEEPAEQAPSQKRYRRSSSHESAQPSQPTSPQGDETQQQTPRPVLTPKSPRDYTGLSSKYPKLPTSLSTISEYTEPSHLSNSAMESTPSRPPREQQSNSTLQMPQSTPARRPSTTPNIRRSAQLRAARAGGTSTPNTMFTPRPAAPPKPREANADARIAKIERMKALERELAELREDKDIQEMQSHKLKRVKIDDLVEIPHNRPGDPSGCFRLPEEDSDDEMEVYESAAERSNVFEETNMQLEKTATPAVQTETSAPQPVQIPDSAMQAEQNKQNQEVPMVFNFPHVAYQPDDYHVSEEYKAECERLFAKGFVEWLKTQ